MTRKGPLLPGDLHYEVHNTHCCKEHCKYGDYDFITEYDQCPVVHGDAPGLDECEICWEDKMFEAEGNAMGCGGNCTCKKPADDMVSITKAKYDSLIEDAQLLECLRAEGVDNWDGWDYAIRRFNGEEED